MRSVQHIPDAVRPGYVTAELCWTALSFFPGFGSWVKVLLWVSNVVPVFGSQISWLGSYKAKAKYPRKGIRTEPYSPKALHPEALKLKP